MKLVCPEDNLSVVEVTILGDYYKFKLPLSSWIFKYLKKVVAINPLLVIT